MAGRRSRTIEGDVGVASSREDEEDLRGFEWRFLDARCRENLLDPLLKKDSSVQSLAFSPKGTHLAIVFSNGELLLYDLISGRPHTLVDGNGQEGLSWARTSPFLRQATSGGSRSSLSEVYVWRASPEGPSGFTRDENIAVQHAQRCFP